MAVYTHITKDQLSQFLTFYDVGTLVSYEGIMQGVENTNYHVFTDRGRFILTLFEKRVNESDLPFFFAFTAHLAGKGLHCPDALLAKNGEIIGFVAGRPAVLISYLQGSDIKSADITPDHCREMGAGAARLHVATQDFSRSRENTMYVAAWQALFSKTRERANEIEPGLRDFLGEELKIAANDLHYLDLPAGVIHADLFPDNVFFKDNKLFGFLDFYFSCTGFFAYDLALVINSWCFDTTNNFDKARFDALLAGYESVRKLTPAEKDSMQFLCRVAALRIIMTRLHDWLFRNTDSLVIPKDPREYIAKLKFHRDHDVIKES